MSPSRVVTWVLAWLVVVAVGSTLVWAVISRAGERIVASDDPLVATSGTSASQAAKPEPTASASKSEPTPSTATPPPTSSTSTPPATSGTSRPPSSPSSPRTPPALELERRTWQGPGGLVVAQCKGTTISRVSLLPDNGYQVELKNDGPEELEVEFEGREDESGSSASVHAVCVDGAPVFESEIETGD